ncbi:MAG: peptide chain release factor N(5)-glutamine methyltransferase [Acidobacteriota bacterium]|jgi:release factor glutamine methyltransferase|nr:MAG: peptide chain release factor N(5)-glutamine methyltransferase [Acidobacteriota bacterium]
MTAAEAVRRALETIGTGHENARADAVTLLRHLLGWDMAGWIVRQHEDVPPDLLERFNLLIARRAAGEPVAYLVGEKEFYGRSFRVGPAVLIPRPETELLVERALAAVDALDRPDLRVIDVGTGSGCIAVTLVCERPSLRVTATDVSAEALALAKENAARHDAVDRIAFVHAPLTGGAVDVDLIVSNPPYIPEAHREQLMPDVRDFEPHGALFGGEDGLAVIRALADDARRALRGHGVLLVEIGFGQAADVQRLLEARGFGSIRVHRDLAGIERVVEARPGRASV